MILATVYQSLQKSNQTVHCPKKKRKRPNSSLFTFVFKVQDDIFDLLQRVYSSLLVTPLGGGRNCQPSWTSVNSQIKWSTRAKQYWHNNHNINQDAN